MTTAAEMIKVFEKLPDDAKAEIAKAFASHAEPSVQSRAKTKEKGKKGKKGKKKRKKLEITSVFGQAEMTPIGEDMLRTAGRAVIYTGIGIGGVVLARKMGVGI